MHESCHTSVTHMNESCHTLRNESCHTYTNESCHTYECVMSHIVKSHIHERVMSHIHERVMSHIHERVMSHIHEWVVSHIWARPHLKNQCRWKCQSFGRIPFGRSKQFYRSSSHHTWLSHVTRMNEWCHTQIGHMGWLRLVGSLKLQVSFADYSLFYRALFQMRPIILRSLLVIATPYHTYEQVLT